MKRLFFALLFTIVTSCRAFTPISDLAPARFTDVKETARHAEREVVFPTVDMLSPIGANIKPTDESALGLGLYEQKNGKVQFALAWHGQVWEFRGTCDKKMDIKLMKGNAAENNEDEWKVDSPSTMTFWFERQNRQHKFVVTCDNGTWMFEN